MKATLIYVIVAALIVVGIVFLAFGHKSTATLAQSGNPSNNVNATNSSKVLFADAQYSAYSYLISPGQLSQQAQNAMDGFNMTTANLTNGSSSVTLTVIGTTAAKNFVLKPGYKLYIVETSFGDDGYHFDSSLGDDGFVVVDPSGYVV